MDTFHSRIQKALNDTALQAALDGNAERRPQAFKEAYKSLPKDLHNMRRQAHKVKEQTIKNLDKYLAEFTKNAEENGFIACPFFFF